MANGKQELQETLEEWNGLFTRHGLEKTEVLHIAAGWEETNSGGQFRVPRRAVCGDGKTEREVCRRAQVGANAWRAVEWVMADRLISKD